MLQGTSAPETCEPFDLVTVTWTAVQLCSLFTCGNMIILTEWPSHAIQKWPQTEDTAAVPS